MAKYFGVLNVDDGNGIEFTRYGGVNINFSKAYVVEELEDDIILCWGQNGAKEWQYVVIDGYYGKCNIIAKSSVYMNKNDFIKVLKKARNFEFEYDMSDIEILNSLKESKKENKTMKKSLTEDISSFSYEVQTYLTKKYFKKKYWIVDRISWYNFSFYSKKYDGSVTFWFEDNYCYVSALFYGDGSNDIFKYRSDNEHDNYNLRTYDILLSEFNNWFEENVEKFTITESKENKTMKKSLTEKRISTEDKIQALAEYKGVEIDEVEEGYDENHFEVDGEEWIVADYDTAYDLAVDYTEQLFDDLGIELVNEDVQNYFLENEEYCSFPWEDNLHEFNLRYAKNIDLESGSNGYATRLVEEAIDRKVIKEKDCFENEDGELDYENKDELAEMLADDMDDDYDSMGEWFESIYGRGWAREMKDTLENYLDYRAMAKYVVDKDGIAYYLASCDSKEVELTKDLYGYRTN